MTDPAKDGFDLDEFFAEAKPTIAIAKVCPRGDLLAQHDELSDALQKALAADGQQNKGHTAPGVADQLKALEAEIEAAMRTFRFQSIGRFAWRQLKEAHPHLDDDGKPKADFDPATGQFVDFDVDTFPVAAIAASSLAPKITEEQATKLAESLNDAQFGELWKATVIANLGVVVDAPKSQLASAVRRLPRGDGSSTSWNGESLPASETEGDAGPLSSPSTTTPDD